MAVLPLIALACAAQAAAPGSVTDYRLPPGPAAAPPPVQGPVDSEAPSARPTQPAPAPTASPSPAPRVVVPSFSPTPAARATHVPQGAAPSPGPQQAATAAPLPAASDPAEIATEPALPSANPLPEAAPLAPAEPAQVPWLWIAAGAGALLLIAGLGMLMRRRKRSEYVPEAPEAEEPASTLPEVSAPAALPPVQLSAATPTPAPSPPTPDPQGIEARFEAGQFSRTLVYATLGYRLTLTNLGTDAAPPSRVLGDMISAHASIAVQEQLSLAAAALPLRHEVPTLSPGETLTLTGDLRIPVATIRPVMQGIAALFVPLARFRIERADGTGTDHIFVVGQLGETPGGALKPLRIDGMPGVIKLLDQRRVATEPA